MKKKLYSFLTDTFLFKNMSADTIQNAVNEIDPQIRTFVAKEEIFAPKTYEQKLCFIISGECLVERIKGDGNRVPLNVLKAGQSFGIMSILSCEDEFPTSITAKKNSEILLISKGDTLKLIENYPTVAMNVITFLVGKVSFLNSKIATFSSSSVEEKLLNYIYSEQRRTGLSIIPFNCKKSAEAISAGRASLYRAINSLTKAGIIKL